MDATFLVPALLIATLLVAVILLARSARIVNQYEKGIVMRMGKFHGLVSSGLTIIMPLTDSIIRVDMR
jgi:regulator of protease activity HflC (stomatin/prohibitin superfamily)